MGKRSKIILRRSGKAQVDLLVTCPEEAHTRHLMSGHECQERRTSCPTRCTHRVIVVSSAPRILRRSPAVWQHQLPERRRRPLPCLLWHGRFHRGSERQQRCRKRDDGAPRGCIKRDLTQPAARAPAQPISRRHAARPSRGPFCEGRPRVRMRSHSPSGASSSKALRELSLDMLSSGGKCLCGHKPHVTRPVLFGQRFRKAKAPRHAVQGGPYERPGGALRPCPDLGRRRTRGLGFVGAPLNGDC